MAVFLVCEGENNGLDNRVLDSLVIQHFNLTLQMAPSGGSGGLGAVRRYLENLPGNNTAIYIEDRDYDQTHAQAHAGWGNPAANRYHWRRHEIENYLLEPRVVLALFDDLRAAGVPWAAPLPATEADVLVLLQTVASALLENHAGEVLRVELRDHSTATGNLQFGPPRPAAPPGATVPGQVAWVPALQNEAARLGTACTAAAGHPALQAAAIAARYQVLLAQFQVPAFLTSGDFLRDMGGHELMAALAAHLRQVGAPPAFTDRFLENELLRVLTPIYAPGVIYQPDDFQELATILAQYPP
jgi:hypothetical protein